ncbi:MAG: hypothetical protein IPG79_15630 [Saprospiraceae bacterium]|nr:hypothetical protein [Saprospiraceae bacterium]
MERNQVIGLLLIFSTLLVWTFVNKPSSEELEKRQKMRDSIALSEQKTEANIETIKADTAANFVPDSLVSQQNAGIFGAFAGASTGKETNYVLENELIKINFSSKEAELLQQY